MDVQLRIASGGSLTDAHLIVLPTDAKENR